MALKSGERGVRGILLKHHIYIDTCASYASTPYPDLLKNIDKQRRGLVVGGPAQVFLPNSFFWAGDVLFSKLQNHPKKRQTPNKERLFFRHDENRPPSLSRFYD